MTPFLQKSELLFQIPGTKIPYKYLKQNQLVFHMFDFFGFYPIKTATNLLLMQKPGLQPFLESGSGS